MIEFEQMEPFPANENPFCHDRFHMGTLLGSNCVIMHVNFSSEKAKYLIIVNVETGERMRINFAPKEYSVADMFE